MAVLVLYLATFASAKTQAAGHNMYEGFDHQRWENPSKIWATPNGGSPHKKTQKEAFAPCLLALTLVGDVHNQSKGL